METTPLPKFTHRTQERMCYACALLPTVHVRRGSILEIGAEIEIPLQIMTYLNVEPIEKRSFELHSYTELHRELHISIT